VLAEHVNTAFLQAMCEVIRKKYDNMLS
jgi:hypothetical protein